MELRGYEEFVAEMTENFAVSDPRSQGNVPFMAQMATQTSPARSADISVDVELRKVFKVYNGEPAVRGIDLSIRRGEFFSILGPFGLRQDDESANDWRGLITSFSRGYLDSRSLNAKRSSLQTSRKYRFSKLCSVRTHDGLGKHCIRLKNSKMFTL